MNIRGIRRKIHLSNVTYLANLKRNMYLTVSVAVGIFLFLLVALYLDFSSATMINGYHRFQDNYISVSTTSEKTMERLKETFYGKTSLAVDYGYATGELYTDTGEKVVVNNEVIAVPEFVEDIYIYLGLDNMSDTDNYSNPYKYEKFKLLCGRKSFSSRYEVIISEEYASLLCGDYHEAIGKKVTMATSGNAQVYTVIGVYRQILDETRINKELLEQLGHSGDVGMDSQGLLFVVFTPENGISQRSIWKRNLYLFFQDQNEYQEEVSVLEGLMQTAVGDDLFDYMTPFHAQEDEKFQRAYNIEGKGFLMVIVAVLSGISIFGTMVNSIADRKKEIGIKKALGASDGDIMLGFVVENMFNTMISILIASFLASLLFLVYGYYQRQILCIDYIYKFYPETILLFVIYSVSSIVGFSLIPAYSASQVNIIDTLREE